MSQALRSVDPPAIGGHPFRVTYFGDIPDEHQKEEIVEDLLGAGETTVTYGLPGCGKSVLIGDGACHVAAGRSWFGRKVRAGAVIYVAAERHALVKRRMAAWRKRHGLDGLPLVVVDGVFDLFGSREHADALVRLANELARLTETAVVWLIIDTKAQVMGGRDPNSDQDVAAFGANLQVLHAGLPGAHVTVIDHVPHSSPDRMKGSGALAGLVDGSFLVKKEGKFRSMSVGSKAPNDGPEDFEIAFTLDEEVLGVSPEGKRTTAPVVVPADRGQQHQGQAAPERPIRLTPAERLAVRALGYVMDHGDLEDAPSLPGGKPGQKAAPVTAVKARAMQTGFSADQGEKPENVRKRWYRTVEALAAKKLVRVEGDLIWALPTGRDIRDTP